MLHIHQNTFLPLKDGKYRNAMTIVWYQTIRRAEWIWDILRYKYSPRNSCVTTVLRLRYMRHLLIYSPKPAFILLWKTNKLRIILPQHGPFLLGFNYNNFSISVRSLRKWWINTLKNNGKQINENLHYVHVHYIST